MAKEKSTLIKKVEKRTKKIGSYLCVGLDSDIEKIPDHFHKLKYPQFEFNKWIIDQTHQYSIAFKPNLAFYEARGDQGLKELKMTMEYLQENHPDIFTIADAKRADIGTTNEGYIKSVFDWLGFDAITLHPYLGKEALQPFLDRKDKVSIILCRTSNPGAGELQDLKILGRPLWSHVAEKVVNEWNEHDNCMLVVGATYLKELAEIRKIAPKMHFLIPGVGAQGGDMKETIQMGQRTKENGGGGMLINSARGVIFAKDPDKEAYKLAHP